ncbi:relaxase/mobilization nuclease domain-containing protein [Sulfitobacter pacificus]|uniref:relaxase/mobilization nuclease domain-containing protein n=1 Tax=Sulfitobacter pacificus TaxID=1499314 RepID=UPI0031054308
MIIKASQRSGGRALADHLMNDKDNDHISVLGMRGFIADDLHGALDETYAVSKATKCTQYLFSVSLSPPEDYEVSEDAFHDAADRIEAKLGLTDQPRAIILHEKNGRRHAHAVWSRIYPETVKAINLPHLKVKLRDVARDLFLDHGWALPKGLATYGDKDPLNFTLAEWQQAIRQNVDPREIKQIFQQVWERSDNLDSFSNGLAERGFHLAKGDRRGHVALDVHGNVYAIAKWTGIKAKDVRAKLGDPSACSSVTNVGNDLKTKMTDQVKDYIAQVKQGHAQEMQPLFDERASMVMAQRAERKMLKAKQEERWTEESKARSGKLNKGLRGLFDFIVGKARTVQKRNERDAVDCARRDQEQRDRLVVQHLYERRELQRRAKAMKERHNQDRDLMARNIISYLKRPALNAERPDTNRQINRNFGLSPDR